ncbi:RBBP9/YdeN family alpha/beta hydrolase [Massilia cavernae]|uniref:Serine hydrolase family protein n=1 Tax=Massilia cavernae TaxID=2320864 RepID=A0A418XGH1_9BURK|nr:alpha/beta hydrolase [Massilia cavernae]RJG11556.1 serine hydrolase family protein [Massilia cavernae]
MQTTTLIVPGFHGSGPGHWQTWMEGQLPDARRVSGIDWERPVLASWAEEVRREIDEAPGAVWLVAHSFGCLASVIAAADRPGKVAGLLLVAPAEPRRFSLFGTREDYPDGISVAQVLPQAPLASSSLMVASRDDPWLQFERAVQLADQWGSRLMDLGNAGHVNTESGFGAWPAGLSLLAGLQDSVEDFPLGAIDTGLAAVKGRRSALARLRHHTRANLGA